MIYLELFLAFLQIGAFSFGGGYGMIALIRETCLGHGWLTEEELLGFIAVAESTPGPIAVNTATLVGAEQGGILGALVATLGIVLPSYIIILLIASVLGRLLKYAGVRATLGGIRPAVVGLIGATALTMLLSLLFNLTAWESTPTVEWRALLIFGILGAASFAYTKKRKRPASPILLILLSAVLGVLLYGV